MFYSIYGLQPIRQLGGYGFCIRLWPEFKVAVANYNRTEAQIHTAVERLGRGWLDCCGYDKMFDPDNCGFDADKKAKLGPRTRRMYEPNRDLRVSWGNWGIEHISVPGDACGLDVGTGPMTPRDGRILTPHNVDCWRQVQLLLVVFCWFADDIALNWELKNRH